MARSLELEEVISWQPGLVEGWQRMQAKRAYDIVLGKMLQNEGEGAFDEPVPYLKAMHVQWNGIIWDDLPKMWAAPEEIAEMSVQPGDLLVCEGGEVGRAAMVEVQPDEPTIIQKALHRVRGNERGDVRFLAYCLRNAADQGWFDVLCNRSTIAHFTVEKFRELWLCLPPLPTQHRIADYLDAETQRIDELIAAKRSMLALLEKKRAALVSQAVTKGLDPNAKMKDSGLEWLGEIPEHWGVERMKYVTDVRFSSVNKKTEANEESVRLCNYTDVYHGAYLDSTLEYMSASATAAEVQRFTLRASDVIVTKDSESPTDICVPAVLVEDVEGLVCGYHLALLRPETDRLLGKYLYWMLDSPQVRQQVYPLAMGITRFALGLDDIGSVRLPLPPIAEQLSIVRWLEDESKNLDNLSSSLSASITLLVSRRSALITAAVTGQVGVAELVKA